MAILKVWDGAQWVSAGAGPAVATLATAAPATPMTGQLWYDTDDVSADPMIQDWAPYTPAWSATGTAPVLGNGTITGTYQMIGNTLLFRVLLVFGSTSTYGTGSWLITLPPVAPHADYLVPAAACGVTSLRDTSAAARAYRHTVLNSTTNFVMSDDAGANVLTAVPFAWATGDSVLACGQYGVA